MGFHFEVICSLQKPTRLNHFSKCFLRFKESGEVSTYSYDAESEIIYNFRFLRSGCFSPKVLFSYTKLQYFLSIFYYILSYTNFKFNIKEIHNASYTVLMSYCKFWIYWVGVNTKFTIWHVHYRSSLTFPQPLALMILLLMHAFFRLVIVYKKPVDPTINKNMPFVNTI